MLMCEVRCETCVECVVNRCMYIIFILGKLFGNGRLRNSNEPGPAGTYIYRTESILFNRAHPF